MDSKIRRSIALEVEPIMQKSSKVTGTPHEAEGGWGGSETPGYWFCFVCSSSFYG